MKSIDFNAEKLKLIIQMEEGGSVEQTTEFRLPNTGEIKVEAEVEDTELEWLLQQIPCNDIIAYLEEHGYDVIKLKNNDE